MSPRVYVRRPLARLPFPLNRPERVLFARGRHALWNGVMAAGLGAGDEILMPAYNCGSELQALIEAALAYRFYDVGETLEPQEAELESLIGPRTRALFLIHYFGFPQASERWRAWCDRHGLLLIEDCAMAWMASTSGRPVGSFGDISIFSLYKTLPLPDGAALVLRSGSPATSARDGSGLVALGKRHLQWLMTRSARVDALLGRLERDVEGQDFALGDPASAPSAATRFLLRRLAAPAVVERRRAHYEHLLGELGGHVPTRLASLPEGATPLVFPLDAESDPGVAERLQRATVEARPIWSEPHVLVDKGFPGADGWRRRVLALPVHQELRECDIERIVRAVRGKRPS